MNPLANPYLRIAIGAGLSQYVAPKIINRFVRVELDERDERLNAQIAIGISAVVTAFTFVALGMATGKTAAEAAKPGA